MNYYGKYDEGLVVGTHVFTEMSENAPRHVTLKTCFHVLCKMLQ